MFESLMAKESPGLQVCTLTPMDAWPAQAARLPVKRPAQQDDLTRQVQVHPSICGHADQEVAVGDSTPFSRNPLNPRPTWLNSLRAHRRPLLNDVNQAGSARVWSIRADKPYMYRLCSERFV